MSPTEQLTEQIAKEVKEKGGRAFYTGGYVRNKIIGTKNNTDIDIDVFGLNHLWISSILSRLCRYELTGKKYAVYNLCDYNIDIVLTQGNSIEEAMRTSAAKRDFTFNALFEDILTGEIFDLFNSRFDINHKIIRATNDDIFKKDPIRILRAARFASTLGFKIHPNTFELCTKTKLDDVSSKSVYSEISKALLESNNPSVFFETLRSMRQLGIWFPELMQTIGAEQNKEWHQEGDVWAHTMMVLNEAAQIKDASSLPLEFMLSALCHDFGKPHSSSTDEKGIIHTYQHELAGLEPAQKFITRICRKKDTLAYILSMVEMHMSPMRCVNNKSRITTTNKMFDKSICPEDLIRLCECDQKGRIPKQIKGQEFLQARLKSYREIMSRPYVTDTDLLHNGIPDGKFMQKALEHAHKLRLAGIKKDEALKQTLGHMRIVMRKDDKEDGFENDDNHGVLVSSDK